ncbi:MAG: glycosyltransferase [Clostridiales bacterium]|jgi:glycosyltransferase involved in cell wall biosynthesis|nr:glycosyltransferase [Clostridiales bacterium]
MLAVSIITPVYKSRRYLRQCVDSLISQTLENIEIILVDDGSDCSDICDFYERSDSRVTVIRKRNEGLSAARNDGVNAAKGEFIAFVDSDDFADRRMFESLYKAARLRKADTAFCCFNRLSGRKVTPRREVSQVTVYEDMTELIFGMFGSLPHEKNDYRFEPSVWRGIYSHKVINGADLSFVSEKKFISEDIIFNIQYLSSARKAVIIPDCLYYYRKTPKSLSAIFREDRFEKNKTVRDKIIRTLENSDLYASRYLLSSARTQACHIAHSSISVSEKKRLLRNIASDADFISVYNGYPVDELPLRHKIFIKSLYKRRVGVALTLAALNGFIKKWI